MCAIAAHRRTLLEGGRNIIGSPRIDVEVAASSEGIYVSVGAFFVSFLLVSVGATGFLPWRSYCLLYAVNARRRPEI
jgi:hypothetical protein